MEHPKKVSGQEGLQPDRPFQTRPMGTARPSKVAYSGPQHPTVNSSPDHSGQNISKTDPDGSSAVRPNTAMTNARKLGSD